MSQEVQKLRYNVVFATTKELIYILNIALQLYLIVLDAVKRV